MGMRTSLKYEPLTAYLRAQRGGRFDERARLAIKLDDSRLLFCLFESLFGVAQILIGLFQLLIEKPCALVGLTKGQVLREIAKLINVAIGKVGGALRISVFDREVDQPILTAAVHSCVVLKFFARIR